jgi:hypothetical protein
MNKQSSIDWFQEQIIQIVNGTCELTEIQIFEQAKAMHKEEIIDAFYEGIEKESNEHGAMYLDKTEAKQYYKETFGGQDNE